MTEVTESYGRIISTETTDQQHNVSGEDESHTRPDVI